MTGTVRVRRRSDPDRVVVSDDLGRVATFTTAARTVTVRGPSRTFREATTSASVSSTTWVRLLPVPFTGSVDWSWLSARLADRSPDLLDVAAQYVTGAAVKTDATGLRYAGDASYGPVQPDGSRQEGSDFNDYLGVPWTYDSTVDRPENAQLHALDCSGFVRMVFGYRGGVPLTLRPEEGRLPRRAVHMNASAPGAVVIADRGFVPSRLSMLRPGDLVLFDASSDDGTDIDHVGIYLGRDSSRAPRFVSSRKTVDGPTMGDVGGRSTLTGTGLYARSWRAARRL
ncbi:MAG: C40 family peptidase [Euzebyales bacterium]|nr:C40 family peptidase [Euzebyales bacterium]